jgi:diguanylate cyclase (GGDEF)-like protein/PAS domain S-box-containing protein
MRFKIIFLLILLAYCQQKGGGLEAMAELGDFLAKVFFEDGPEAVVDCFSSLQGGFVMTLDGVVVSANRRFCDITGYLRQEMLGMQVTDLIAADEVAAMQQRFLQNDLSRYSLKLVHKDQSIRYVMVSPMSFTFEGNNHRLAEFIDVTPLHEAQQAAIEGERKYSSIFNHAAVGIARVAPDGSWLECNDKVCDIVGYPREELLGLTFQDITHPDDLEKDLGLVGEMLEGRRQTYSMEKRYYRKSGEIIWINLTVGLVRDYEGQPLYFISVIDDIDDKKRAEAQLKYMASHDSLTGLSNRRTVENTLEIEIARALRYERELAVVMIDIDHFKRVNDEFGHDIGDLALKALASHFHTILRTSDSAARFGGEEFLLVLPETDHSRALEISERLRKLVESKTINHDRGAISITVSMGVASLRTHGEHPRQLITSADDAMYRAKATGRNQVCSAVPLDG